MFPRSSGRCSLTFWRRWSARGRTEEEIRKLAQGQRRLGQEVGGLARSVASSSLD